MCQNSLNSSPKQTGALTSPCGSEPKVLRRRCYLSARLLPGGGGSPRESGWFLLPLQTPEAAGPMFPLSDWLQEDGGTQVAHTQIQLFCPPTGAKNSDYFT